ncbi:MAG: tetratricopeptide repeat protein [Planctomycetia bacterium]|nr:tetratricopeptide repeat protein [Planctomycetia bacterium]
MSPETLYLFRHAVLRDAAYQLQLPGDRARLHGRALEAIESLCGGRAPEAPALGPGAQAKFPEHGTDAFAEELFGHAKLSGAPASLVLRYLRRGAATAAARYRNEAAQALWENFARLADGVPRAEALRRAGLCAWIRGARADTERLYRESAAVFDACGEAGAEAAVLASIANLFRETGRPAEAREALDRGLERARAAGDARAEGLLLNNLGALLWRQGAPEAREVLHRALRRNQEAANRGGESSTRELLAILHEEAGRMQEAERSYLEALAIARSLGDSHAEANISDNMASFAAGLGRHDEARQRYEAALAIHREHGNRRGEAATLGNLALHLNATGRAAEAEEMLVRSLALLRESGHRIVEGVMLGNLGTLLHDSGRIDAAADTYLRALAILREVQERRTEGFVLGSLASLRRDQGRLEEADGLFREALSLHRRTANRRYEGTHSCGHALCLVALGRAAEAAAAWRAGEEILRDFESEEQREARRGRMREACAAEGVEELMG